MKLQILRVILVVIPLVLGATTLSGCPYSEYHSSNFDGSKFGDEESYTALYKTLDQTTISNTINMNGYSCLSVTIVNEKGSIDYTITDSVGNVIYTQVGVTNENLNIPIDYPGFIKIDVTGNNAKGKFRFQRMQ